jgi:putative redox protein
MTLRMYADRKDWPLDRVRVTLRHSRIHAKDCADCETKTGWINHIDRDIELAGDLAESQRQRLLHIAERCPVHQTLTSEVHIATSL